MSSGYFWRIEVCADKKKYPENDSGAKAEKERPSSCIAQLHNPPYYTLTCCVD